MDTSINETFADPDGSDEDPDSQDAFDVEDEDGQRQFTTVKLFRDDIGELL